MALQRSAGVGAVTLCVALAGGAEAAGIGHDRHICSGGVDAGTIVGSAERTAIDRVEVTLVARRGFGATGRKTASGGGE